MSEEKLKADLRAYLQTARDVVLWKLDGASEYDVRRPLTPTGTNLLGLVKHLANVEFGYFGPVFGREPEEDLSWGSDEADTEDADPNQDMWATADESRADIVALYRRAWAWADATIEARGLADLGRVPWWPPERAEPTLHKVLVHVVAETNRHAGHMDILRELVDGAAGHREGNDNLAPGDATWWAQYRDKLERMAKQAGSA